MINLLLEPVLKQAENLTKRTLYPNRSMKKLAYFLVYSGCCLVPQKKRTAYPNWDKPKFLTS